MPDAAGFFTGTARTERLFFLIFERVQHLFGADLTGSFGLGLLFGFLARLGGSLFFLRFLLLTLGLFAGVLLGPFLRFLSLLPLASLLLFLLFAGLPPFLLLVLLLRLLIPLLFFGLPFRGTRLLLLLAVFALFFLLLLVFLLLVPGTFFSGLLFFFASLVLLILRRILLVFLILLALLVFLVLLVLLPLLVFRILLILLILRVLLALLRLLLVLLVLLLTLILFRVLLLILLFLIVFFLLVLLLLIFLRIFFLLILLVLVALGHKLKIVLRVTVLGIQAKRLPVKIRRLCRVAAAHERVAEVVKRLGLKRRCFLSARGFFVRRERLLERFFFIISIAEVKCNLGRSRIVLLSFQISGGGLPHLAFLVMTVSLLILERGKQRKTAENRKHSRSQHGPGRAHLHRISFLRRSDSVISTNKRRRAARTSP